MSTERNDNLIEPLHLDIIEEVQAPDFVPDPVWYPFPDDVEVAAGESVDFEYTIYAYGADQYWTQVEDDDREEGNGTLTYAAGETETGTVNVVICATNTETGKYADQTLIITITDD